MSYENLEKARAERAVKEAANEAKKSAKKDKKVAPAGKENHGRKCKSSKEAGAPESKTKDVRMSEAQVEEVEIAPELWALTVLRSADKYPSLPHRLPE